MNKIFYFLTILIFTSSLLPQDKFNIDAYKNFLNANENISPAQLMEMHPAGSFKSRISPISETISYLDSIEIKYGLTGYEKSLLQKHGFVVTERIKPDYYSSIGGSLYDIYMKDMPVFISTDAILHAFHMSYDKILMQTELSCLKPKIEEYLNLLHSKLGQLQSQYSLYPELIKNLLDIDLYLTVPRKLLNESNALYFPENAQALQNFMQLITDEKPVEEIFFADSTSRKIDFSQFKTRGHYTQHPELEKYFKAMIWLGKIELYLIAPRSFEESSSGDIQRQAIDAVLISELEELAEAQNLYSQLEKMISFFVGEQDNVTVQNLNQLKENISLTSAAQLLAPSKFSEFQNTLKTKSYAFQQILSQILYSNPFTPDSIVPASAFLLFGQRFVIDSYVTGSVVYDRIISNGDKIKRMLPSTLDVLFAIGNNAAAQLIAEEMENYKYSPNMGALRYLVDSYGEEFWQSSIYNMWLNLIRALNGKEDTGNLPEFMQTAAYWQQKMNTQLASWTELRHDNLLYAKQSYSGGATCVYPYAYVEPFPEFYSLLSSYAKNIKEKFATLPIGDNSLSSVANYFDYFSSVADTLESISIKELNGQAFSPEEELFLKTILYDVPYGCTMDFKGWYANLFYGDTEGGNLMKEDLLVADFHTAPTDAAGNMVGWVKHAGTGRADMAIVIADVPAFQKTAFIGPVMSFYEYTSTNFLRLTDQEWSNTYLQSALRPDWVNIYLANINGESKGAGPSLVTSIEEEPSPDLPESYKITAVNYPNPFNGGTKIKFTIPSAHAGLTSIKVFNINGELISTIFNEELTAGNYIISWSGGDKEGYTLPSGIYFYEIRSGSGSFTGKLIMMK